jgi:transcriptional regulator with XRE-family HTH domain
MANEHAVSDVVAARVREVRGKRDLTIAGLAARCAELGAPELTAQALYKLEGQRNRADRRPRLVTVDELLILAAALNVAPVHLLVPPDDYREPYRLTSTLSEGAAYVRHWIRGVIPLRDADPREYFAEVPLTEVDWQNVGVSWPVPPDYDKEDPGGGL